MKMAKCSVSKHQFTRAGGGGLGIGLPHRLVGVVAQHTSFTAALPRTSDSSCSRPYCTSLLEGVRQATSRAFHL